MRDFTLDTFRLLLTSLKAQNYIFQTFAEFLKNPASRSIILRHDVDARKLNSLQTAKLEKDLEITGTYYFRMVPESFDKVVIKQIADMGHEIGYHYEDLSRSAARGMRHAAENLDPLLGGARGGLHEWLKGVKVQRHKGLAEEELLKLSIKSFGENLEKLRRVVPVETICMHGSPLSNYDNRKLWEKYDYRDFGILGEPYFDINFDEVLYITDTGRRWDGEAVSVRDKAVGSWQLAKGRKGLRDDETKSEELLKPNAARRTPILHFHSTFDIIRAIESGILPSQVMITIHPQRWYNESVPWVRELVWQNLKNAGKWIIVARNQGLGN